MPQPTSSRRPGRKCQAVEQDATGGPAIDPLGKAVLVPAAASLELAAGPLAKCCVHSQRPQAFPKSTCTAINRFVVECEATASDNRPRWYVATA